MRTCLVNILQLEEQPPENQNVQPTPASTFYLRFPRTHIKSSVLSHKESKNWGSGQESKIPVKLTCETGQCLQLTRKRQQRSNQVWGSFLPGLDYCRSRGPRKLSKPFSTEENSSSRNLCPHGPPTDLELKL
ncbi:hypothetical protein E5288_WYG021129 [Bos mutus]|uniref:Uncharacterized protein n=1 Tax=Bos mutus TaxID=72004 RepID=A0A6B0RUX0_9CETA|nr:hypothetical protein [Bos mutus]